MQPSRSVCEAVYVTAKTRQVFGYLSGFNSAQESFDRKTGHPAESLMRMQGRAWISEEFIVSFFLFGDLPKGVGHGGDTETKREKKEVVFARTKDT